VNRHVIIKPWEPWEPGDEPWEPGDEPWEPGEVSLTSDVLDLSLLSIICELIA
jgi:hypothetical protein